jgi:hypothetical protein
VYGEKEDDEVWRKIFSSYVWRGVHGKVMKKWSMEWSCV